MDYSKVFYVKRNKKVVACKFESLYFWYSSMANGVYKHEEQGCYVSYRLILADGSNESGYYGCLPRISETIDDCLNEIYVERPPKYLTPDTLQEAIGFVPETIHVTGILSYDRYEAWMWDGFAPVFKPIGSMDGGPCRSECWYNALTRRFENRKWYASREECAKDNAIQVINF